MGDAPDAPDPFRQAAAQQGAELGASTASSIINNPNQYNPYGSQTYTIAGYEQVPDAQGNMQMVPRYNQTTMLSPDQMRLLGLQTQSQYNLGSTAVQQSAFLKDYLGKMVDPGQWQAWARGQAPGEVRQDQGPTDRAAIEKAIMGRQTEAMAKRSAAEDAQLAARGLSPGSAQYGDVSDARTRAMTDAQQQAYLASGGESREAQAAYNAAGLQKYQMGQDYASFLNNLRQAQGQETFALRNQPLNEISALLSGSQVTAPQFNPFSAQGINAAPVGQYIGQNYANQLQASNAQNTGLFGLGGSLLGAIGESGGLGALTGLTGFFSDRRLKQNIRPTGSRLAGLPLYRFRFRGSDVEQIGVMSDEVRLVYPEAVTTSSSGYDLVDYGLLLAKH